MLWRRPRAPLRRPAASSEPRRRLTAAEGFFLPSREGGGGGVVMDDSQTDGVVKPADSWEEAQPVWTPGARFTWIPRHGEPAINLQRLSSWSRPVIKARLLLLPTRMAAHTHRSEGPGDDIGVSGAEPGAAQGSCCLGKDSGCCQLLHAGSINTLEGRLLCVTRAAAASLQEAKTTTWR